MRICPKCSTPYPNNVAQCRRDGTILASITDSLKNKDAQSEEKKPIPGLIIGNYQLHKQLGFGGMGFVYQATHLSLGKQVAIKIIKEEETENPITIERFFREARAVVKLNHPNIVQLLDFGSTPEGRLYLVMEFLQGQTLANLLEETPILPCAQAISITRQACLGLEIAHQHKIIHRDLKPENIMLTNSRGEGDLVKILDFGIAEDIAEKISSQSKALTQDHLIGTPHYMAPEQGSLIDHRSDIYSLGLILYRMLTGRVPFYSDNVMDLLYKHITAQPESPKKFNPNIPALLEKIVLRALHKDKEKRFASMKAFDEALSKTLLSPKAQEEAIQANPELFLTPLPHNVSLTTINSPVTDQSTLSTSAGEHITNFHQKKSSSFLLGSILFGLGLAAFTIWFLFPGQNTKVSTATTARPAKDISNSVQDVWVTPLTVNETPSGLSTSEPASQQSASQTTKKSQEEESPIETEDLYSAFKEKPLPKNNKKTTRSKKKNSRKSKKEPKKIEKKPIRSVEEEFMSTGNDEL